MTPDVAIAVQELWKCDPIQQTYARRTEFWILDACGYYMSNCHRFVQSTFVPNDYDIVMSRRRTTGIVEAQFMDEGAKWTVVDVGGQRSERRKWMLCFDGVDAVIFFVNSAGFNRPLFEDNQVTEHQEALQLLESTFSNKIFKDTPVFLFFNKLDLFRDALDRGRPIGKYFPEYKGEMMEIPMLDHLSKLYQTKMPNGKPLAQVHFISACNRNDCQKGFKRVREYLISNKHNTIKKEGESGKTPQFGAEVFTQPREDTQTPQPGAPAPLISPTAVHTELPGSFDSTSNTTKTESNISQGDEPGLEKRDMPKGLPTLLLPRDVEPI
jgi:GTPase SAR1 family protein